jgi:hypothetical protein
MGTCTTKSYMGSITFTKACLSYVRAIMTFRRVSLIQLLRQVMGWIQHLSTCCQMRMDSCGYVPS